MDGHDLDRAIAGRLGDLKSRQPIPCSASRPGPGAVIIFKGQQNVLGPAFPEGRHLPEERLQHLPNHARKTLGVGLLQQSFPAFPADPLDLAILKPRLENSFER